MSESESPVELASHLLMLMLVGLAGKRIGSRLVPVRRALHSRTPVFVIGVMVACIGGRVIRVIRALGKGY